MYELEQIESLEAWDSGGGVALTSSARKTEESSPSATKVSSSTPTTRIRQKEA